MNTSFARRSAVTFALLAFLASSALAASLKPTSAPGLGFDGRKARPAVVANRAQRGLSTDVTVRGIRKSASGLSVQVLSAARNGVVEEFNVTKGVARRTPTGLVSQDAAKAAAFKQARRKTGPKAGTYSGVSRSGLTPTGNYKFTSKTDSNERFFVNPVSGRLVHRNN